jgi:Holliday junction resolvase
MSGPEARIQRQMQATVRARGGYVLKVHGSPMMPNGTPDLLACYKGYFLAFEVKTPQTKTDVSPAQRLRLKQIRDAGGGAYVVWDVDRVEEILDSIDRMISVVDDALDSLPEEATEGALDRWHRSVDK